VEIVRGIDDGKSEGEVFRRSSLLMHSPPEKKDAKKTDVLAAPDSRKVGSLPDVGDLQPVACLGRAELPRPRRASTPLEISRMEEDSVIIVKDLTLMQEDAGEASSTCFVPSRAAKRARGIPSDSADSASGTGDESSTVVGQEKSKRRKTRGRAQTTNIIYVIQARKAEREDEQRREREWKRKRMEGPNLVIPPATNLPTLEAVIEELENQPTPDLTSELMQVVRTVEKVATTAKNLNGRYIRALRMAALTVHAGTNLLACRIHGQAGSDADATIADLRKRNRALQLEKERLDRGRSRSGGPRQTEA